VWSLSGASPFTFEDGTIIGYTGTETAVVIPSQIQGQTVTAIGDGFSGKKLTSVTIPNSVTAIWNQVFENNLLTSVTIPDSVTVIGVGAFFDNPLTSITIGANVTFDYPGEPVGVFNSGFDTAYENNGKQAGTYTLNNGVWTKQ